MTTAFTLLPFALFLAVLPFPHTVALRLLLLAVAVGIAVRVWRRETQRPTIPCKAALAAWVLVALASLAYAVDPAQSLGEIKNEIGYTLLAFWAMLVIARDKLVLARILLGLAGGFLVIALWAIGSYAYHGSWQGLDFGGAAGFSTYLVTVLPVLFLAFLARRSAWGNWLLGLFSVLFLIAAVLTQQRAIWPAFASQVLVGMMWLWRRGAIRLSGRAMLGSAAAVVIAAVCAMAYVSLERFSSAPEARRQVVQDIRLERWPAIVERIGEHALAGSGFGRGAMKKGHADLIPESNPLLWHAHNVFLDYGLGMGIPGMVAIAALFGCFGFSFLRLAAHADAEVAAAGIAGVMLVVGVVARNQFNDMFGRDLALLYWALTGLLLGFAQRRKLAHEAAVASGA